MKVIISENKMLSVILKFVKDVCPEIAEPLHTKLVKTGEGNSGWGSSMHDFTYYRLYYYSTNGNPVLYEDDERGDTRWVFNEELPGLMTIYDSLGEEMFEKFFLGFHKLDIKDKRKFKYNWVFE
jgi:hypothetical protein